MKRVCSKLPVVFKEVLIQAIAFLTPLAICLSFPEFAFFTGAVFIGLPLFGLMLIPSIPLFFIYLARINKEPLGNQITCFCFLTGLLFGCGLVIWPRMEYFEYLVFSMGR